nr:structural protein [Sobelivirales sp.]
MLQTVISSTRSSYSLMSEIECSGPSLGMRKQGAGAGPPKQQPAQQKMKRKPRKATRKMEPVATVSRSGNRAPKTKTVKGGTVVSHCETYGTNITGSVNYALSSTWALNPGLQTYSKGSPLGLWLGQIATNFDKYEIQSLKFKFRTACSTLTTGLVFFGFEPNPEGTEPTSYQEIRNMYSVDGSAHANLQFDISSKVRKQLLVRKGNVNNLPNYDVGKVYFGTIGVNENALVGFVDVEYRVKLISPQSSNTSNTVNPVSVLGVLPTWRYEVNAAGVGDINCATSSASFIHTGLLVGGTVTGAPLLTLSTANFAGYDLTIRGCTFKQSSFNGGVQLKHTTPGRYRMYVDLKIGYEDLKMFAITLIHNALGLQCSRRVYSAIDGGSSVVIPTQCYTHRGFAGTAVGDPNPGTEVWPVYMFEYDITGSAADAPVLAIGVVPYNSVSTTTANVRGYTGLGTSVITVEYLGPLIT